MKKSYRIKSRLRFAIFLTMVLVILVCATGTALGSNGKTAPADMCTAVEIVAGDTLWDLAQEYGPQNQDVREVVHAICKLNQVNAGEIYPGQTILIPHEI